MHKITTVVELPNGLSEEKAKQLADSLQISAEMSLSEDMEASDVEGATVVTTQALAA